MNFGSILFFIQAMAIGIAALFMLSSDMFTTNEPGRTQTKMKMNTSTSAALSKLQRITDLECHLSNLAKLYSPNGTSCGSSGTSSRERGVKMTGWDLEWRECTSVDASFNKSHFTTSLDHVKLNRYSDILANENSRVKLDQYNTHDYINANHIPSSMFLHTHTNYIATQGPKETTIGDFWHMCLQQHASLIVMLCNGTESGAPKCAKYWPDENESFQFQNTHSSQELEVRNIKEEVVANSGNTIIHRRLQLFVDGKHVMDLDHLQYIGWPDHGVPSKTDNFRLLSELCDDVRSTRAKTAPVIVHCSAGIGRTGTFMTVSILTEQMRNYLAEERQEPFIFEIMDTVKKLKSLRKGMVQTMSQYQFAYRAILEEAKSLGIIDKNNR